MNTSFDLLDIFSAKYSELPLLCTSGNLELRFRLLTITNAEKLVSWLLYGWNLNLRAKPLKINLYFLHLQAWRKRWFVLRRGRMSGDPDVLEYYQSKNSKKPIRTIDLKECEVEMLEGQLRIKRDFHGKHLFVVKTSSRIFYLVAKTEEEMNSWISSISQICQFGSLEDAGKYVKAFRATPVSNSVDALCWSQKRLMSLVTTQEVGNFTMSEQTVCLRFCDCR